jgi:hypothetical protein
MIGVSRHSLHDIRSAEESIASCHRHGPQPSPEDDACMLHYCRAQLILCPCANIHLNLTGDTLSHWSERRVAHQSST